MRRAGHVLRYPATKSMPPTRMSDSPGTGSDRNPVRVFVCHSSVDAALATEIVGALEREGVVAWMAPRDVASGENYPRQIVKAIVDCDIFAILISDSACASEHVLRELEQASRQKRPLLPILIDEVVSDDIDYYLGAVQRISGPKSQIVGQVVRYFTHQATQSDSMSAVPRRAETSPVGRVGTDDGGPIESLEVGVIPFPPFSRFIDEPASNDAVAAGYYIDLLDALAAEQGIAIRYHPITNDETVKALGSGEIDIVACLYRTPRRTQQFDFAACFFASTVGAVVRADEDRVRSQGDLMRDDIRIVVCQGEIGAELAEDQFGAKRGTRRLIEVDTVEVANIAGLVAAGVADVAVTDNITCQLLVARSGGSLKHLFADFPLYVGHIGLVIPQNQETLRGLLNSSLGRLRQSERSQNAERDLLADYRGVLQPL